SSRTATNLGPCRAAGPGRWLGREKGMGRPPARDGVGAPCEAVSRAWDQYGLPGQLVATFFLKPRWLLVLVRGPFRGSAGAATRCRAPGGGSVLGPQARPATQPRRPSAPPPGGADAPGPESSPEPAGAGRFGAPSQSTRRAR